MLDANGSRFALLLGQADWGRCELLDAAGPPRLEDRWAASALLPKTPLAWDEGAQALALAARISRFQAAQGDLPPDPARRLGAAADRHGNVYFIVDGGRRIDVRSAGSMQVSVYWPVAQAATAAEPGAFGPAEPATPPPPLNLCALAVTCDHYLVAGMVPPAGEPGGLLVFDLLAGGPPLQLGWPAPWRLLPHDMAARADGGVVVLDRVQRRVWVLGRGLAMEAVFPVAPATGGDFTADPSGIPADAPAPRPEPGFALAARLKHEGQPVAVEVLADGAIVVMEDADTVSGFAALSLYVGGVRQQRVSTDVVKDIIDDDDDRQRFVLRGFDMALAARTSVASVPGSADKVLRQHLLVVSHEGNQAIEFALDRQGGGLVLLPQRAFLPLRRYGGVSLVNSGRVAVNGDTGAFYESQGRWLPLVDQRRPRYRASAAVSTEAFDGHDPGCVWHRLVLDGCIPPGTLVRVASRCADDAAQLAGLPFDDEPLPLLRPGGSELPWLIEGPGSATDAAQGHGSWELLFQRARGRWLQLRLTLEGNELATPRLAALRAWYPRFSYAQRYLPAVYREDAASADFLERFLANFEGQFTALEDRIAAASALFDVRSAPAETLDWLAGWLGLVLDPALDDARRRQLIRHAMPLYQYRGTTAALRLAVQLALSRCVPDTDFALPAPSQAQPWGVRLVESFLTRNLPLALLGETTFDTTTTAEPAGAHWLPAEGAAALHQRWRAWLARAGQGDSSALFSPLPPAGALRTEWAGFCQATLGTVPQLAEAFMAAWQRFAASDTDWLAATASDADHGAGLPTRWPRDTDADTDAGVDVRRKAWRRFIGGLSGPLRRWLSRWQSFIARRYQRMERYAPVSGAEWPDFDALPVPTWLPSERTALDDWALFETRLEPMAAHAHSFSVLLPIPGPQADAAELAQQVDLAQRVVRLAKPAHTRFDVRPYWALFRVGQVRLGLDTLLGRGVREDGVAPPMVLGQGHLGAARVALRPSVPPDRLLLEC